MPVFKLREIAEKINGKLFGDGEIIIKDAAKIESAGPGDITFLANLRYKNELIRTNASAVIVSEKMGVDVPIPHILVDDAYYRFLQVFLMFYPRKEIAEPGIHPTAVIHPSVQIGEHVSNCVIMNEVQIGAECLIYPLVSVREECIIGNRVIIHNGAVIGSDGFGFAQHGGIFHKIPQIGRVIVEDDVEIGANCTIDRATMGETIIRKGVKLDNLVHIAHNVEVGESTVMAAQAGISGSTKIGHHVMIGGQVGTVGHITIGNYAQIGAQSGVSKSVPDNETVFGYPARPIMKTKRIEAVLNQLPDLYKKIRVMEKELNILKNTALDNSSS